MNKLPGQRCNYKNSDVICANRAEKLIKHIGNNFITVSNKKIVCNLCSMPIKYCSNHNVISICSQRIGFHNKKYNKYKDINHHSYTEADNNIFLKRNDNALIEINYTVPDSIVNIWKQIDTNIYELYRQKKNFGKLRYKNIWKSQLKPGTYPNSLPNDIQQIIRKYL